jgi:protein-disulfide isomerase
MVLFTSKVRRFTLWGGVSILLVGGVVLMAYFATRPTTFDASTLINPDNTREWFTGPDDAKVTLVEYSDFQCPACAAYNPLIQKISVDYASTVKIVDRYFPLRRIHKNADIAAQAAEAAGLQGKYREMHNLLFDKQTEWDTKSNADEIMIGYAKTLSLDIERFTEDMNSQATKDKIEADLQSGIKSQVDSTPTFFLNGRKIQNPRSYEEFKQLLDNALAQNS